jgi:pescadillo protein
MGYKIRKGTKGEITQYMTRSRAIRHLQLGLKDFRRLCILKGIYPREPKKKFKGNNKTYYHVKDIKFLENDKILKTFREINIHMRKLKRMEARREESEVAILRTKTPEYEL